MKRRCKEFTVLFGLTFRYAGENLVYDDAKISSVEPNGDITVETIATKETRTVSPSKLRRKVTSAVKEKPGHSYSTYG